MDDPRLPTSCSTLKALRHSQASSRYPKKLLPFQHGVQRLSKTETKTSSACRAARPRRDEVRASADVFVQSLHFEKRGELRQLPTSENKFQNMEDQFMKRRTVKNATAKNRIATAA